MNWQLRLINLGAIALNVTAIVFLDSFMEPANWASIGLVLGVWLSAELRARATRLEPYYSTTIRAVPNHGEPLVTHHLRGELNDGQKFVFCPVGNIVSWSGGDYDHRWCHWCKQGFEAFNRKEPRNG